MTFVQILRRCVLASLTVFYANAVTADVERSGGPFVPTPQAVVDAMLEVANVGPRDVVADLGSGDGRIVLTAAQRFNARGFGVEIDPELVQKSSAEAERRGLADRVSFRNEDVRQTPIADATVVTLYLLPGMMQTLESRLLRELKPGTRIVSHDFPFSDWKPDREVKVDVNEKYGTVGQWKSTVFYWVVPAQLGGEWQLSVPALAQAPLRLALEQRYQMVEGGATVGRKRVPLTGGKVEADRVRFSLTLPGGSYDFRGALDGETLRGEASRGGRTVAWRAVRSAPASARIE